MPRKHGCLFLVYEHSGNIEENHLSLPPSQYELILFKHTFSKGLYSHHFFFFIIASFLPGTFVSGTLLWGVYKSAISRSILSSGRSACNTSRNREKEINEMSAAVYLGVLGTAF